MPTFILHKLIRDKLKDEYLKLDHGAKYITLTSTEILEALKQKIIEEAHEILVGGSKADITEELADVWQVIEDMAERVGIMREEIISVKDKKFEKKGGFSEGLFVESVEINSDDEWVTYYRKSPEKYKEIV